MKRLMVLVVGLVFLFCASAFAVEKPAAATKAAPAAAEPSTNAPAKVAKMSATGKVLEISDTALKIERTVKGKAETMEFVLEKAAKAKVGDKVRVVYVEKDGQKVASKVCRIFPKKKRPAKPAPEKPAAPAPEEPATK
jgi:Cu/Ag efflux protein CusF